MREMAHRPTGKAFACNYYSSYADNALGIRTINPFITISPCQSNTFSPIRLLQKVEFTMHTDTLQHCCMNNLLTLPLITDPFRLAIL